MGADMLLAALPAAKLTAKRREDLHRIVDRLNWQDFPSQCQSHRPSADELVEARDSLHGHVDALDGFRVDRQVVTVRLAGWPYPLWFTGGLSWGDSPTDAYDTLAALGAVRSIYEQLKQWASADWLPRKQRLDNETESDALNVLREFVEDIRAVYGGEGEDLDEELLDWPDLVATYRKARALIRVRDRTSVAAKGLKHRTCIFPKENDH